jgi:F0F1-type ATP synthase beta subunit
MAVKFDTDALPSILNALTTTNNNQKLVLEVAVRTPNGKMTNNRLANQRLATSW